MGTNKNTNKKHRQTKNTGKQKTRANKKHGQTKNTGKQKTRANKNMRKYKIKIVRKN
jgi:hypothetical protein